ncbi:MAG: long-chain-fatty-acid--CoA ligase [bacterium]
MREELTSLEQNLLRRNVAGDILKRSARRHPDRRALRFLRRNYTFRELNEAVNRCAHGLMQRGIRKGDRAAILSHNCDSFIIVWWGLLKIGAVLTPLNWMLKETEIRYILDHCEPRALFVEDGLIGGIGNLRYELPSVRTFAYMRLTDTGVPGDWMNIEELWRPENPVSEPEVIIENGDVATLLYTSGTEAMPKGVMNSHLNFTSSMASAQTDILLRQDDVMIGGIPLFHVAGLWMFTACCALGGLTVLEYLPDLREILELTQEERVTRWCWPTTVYSNLPKVSGFENYDLSSLRVCQMFGSPAPPALLDQWRRIVPGISFMNCYGQTEMTPLGATISGREFDLRPDSVGRAMLPVELRIVGADEREVPRGEVGEIVVRGPNVMPGYFRDEEKTQATQRGGWHHTGDLGRMDESGYLYFVDRIKDMIKTGGENVASADVEASLLSHPKVFDAAVIGMPDEVWGEAVTALVVPAQGQTLEEKELLAWCKSRMAAFKVPKKVFVVAELPRNPSGKILKRELRQKYAAPV